MSFIDDFVSKLQQRIAPTNAPSAQSTSEKAADALAQLAYNAVVDKGKNLVSQFRESGTGSKIIADVKQQEIKSTLNNPTTWVYIVGAVLLLFGLGYMAARK